LGRENVTAPYTLEHAEDNTTAPAFDTPLENCCLVSINLTNFLRRTLPPRICPSKIKNIIYRGNCNLIRDDIPFSK